MSDHSKIEWTEATWNPTTGCTRVSEGCDHCYIERTPPFRMAGRRFTGPGHASTCRTVTASNWERTQETVECTCPGSRAIGASTGIALHSDRISQPLRWRKPPRVFVNSLSDLFHADIPDAVIARVFEIGRAHV